MKTIKKIYYRFLRFFVGLTKENSRFKELIDSNKSLIMASIVNSQLSKYRAIHNGKDIFIVGGGPSLSKFKTRVNEDSIYIGINKAFLDQKINFDYLFVQDNWVEGFQEFINYRKEECIKFLAIINVDNSNGIRQFDATKIQGTRYVLDGMHMGPIPYDISIQPFADLRGTVFSALQFAFYTEPKRIFLVGFDLGFGNYYSKYAHSYDYQYDSWIKIKQHADLHYKEIEIISINPIGLKGLFKEIYED